MNSHVDYIHTKLMIVDPLLGPGETGTIQGAYGGWVWTAPAGTYITGGSTFSRLATEDGHHGYLAVSPDAGAGLSYENQNDDQGHEAGIPPGNWRYLVARRPLLAILGLAGLRISEALALRWRDVNLAGRKLRVAASKTDAGVREVDMTPTLQELLSEYRTRTRHNGSDDFVFPTSGGKQDNPSNVRSRFLAAAVTQANVELHERGRETIKAITPHSLRRTFISLLLAAGADVPYVMAQAGHTDPKMTLGL